MIVEERNYTMVPGGVAEYLRLWEECGRASQVAHLGEPLGVYRTEVGELNTLVYLWRYESLRDREKRRGALAADPGFAAFRRRVRDLLVAQENRILAEAAPGGTK
ncbi:NIPSNAP family protein [Actinomadura sp. 1N219]|uniref:NIPSNAP family protein n=1 Tax=Actinomadura sp. 1N219 TaxID=3375152 RepID=UPI003793AEE5